MARLEDAINTIVDIFVEYADGDGKLNKDEMMKLVEKEIGNPEIKAKLCSAADSKKGMRRLHKSDGEIHFKEFSQCVRFMSNRFYRMKTGKGEECDDESDENK